MRLHKTKTLRLNHKKYIYAEISKLCIVRFLVNGVCNINYLKKLFYLKSTERAAQSRLACHFVRQRWANLMTGLYSIGLSLSKKTPVFLWGSVPRAPLN